MRFAESGNCYLQYSLQRHTHYGIAEQGRGKGIASAAGSYMLTRFLGHCCAYGGTRDGWEEQLFHPLIQDCQFTSRSNSGYNLLLHKTANNPADKNSRLKKSKDKV